MAPRRVARRLVDGLEDNDDYCNGYDSADARLLEFAKDALAKAAEIAADIAARKMVCAAGCLAANLIITKSMLDAAGVKQMKIVHRRLPKLLEDLEVVCLWPYRPKLRESVHVLEDLIDNSRYRSTARKRAEEQARQGILSFSKEEPGIRDQYSTKLEQFAKKLMSAGEDDDDHGQDRKASDEETPDAYPNHVNANLYAALKQHSLCTCTWKRSRSESGASVGSSGHLARLRLNDKIVKVDGCVSFDMLFSASTFAFDHWQELQLRVAMRKKAKKLVHYGDNPASGAGAASPSKETLASCDTAKRSRLVQPGSFCRLVKTPMGSRICCFVQDTELHQLHDGAPLQQHIAGSSMSLREIFEQCKLTNRMKLVFAYILSRSFWQFYDSPWMDSAWSSDSIHFLREAPMDDDDEDRSLASGCSDINGSEEGGFFASRPCLAVDFDDQGVEAPMEYCDDYSVTYRYPRILALCIMLLEIAEGRSLTLDNEESMSSELKLNETLNMAKKHVHRKHLPKHLRKEFDFPDYRKAINRCLRYEYKPDDQETAGGDYVSTARTVETDVFARKAMIYSTVVQPLERLLKNLDYAESLHIIDPIDMSRSPDPVIKLQEPLPAESLTSQLEKGNTTSTNASAQWLQSINDINTSIHQLKKVRKSKGRHQPVRIAVLDTGYDPEAVFFQNSSRKRRIKGWQDFTEVNESPVDSSGHGTHTLALLMKIAPAADIYVARIAKDRSGLQNAADNIAKAIEWAASYCSVDVMAMAFGFPDEVPVITDALLKAHLNRSNKLICLAAASNSGANRKETFPAFLDEVISVRETNHLGAFSDSNPPVDPSGPIVFGTLGKDVPSAWLSTMAGEIPKSGSSVATAVAAGLVAMVLEFVSIGINDAEAGLPNDVQRAWTRRGMLDVLRRMSSDMGNRSYFISPISFFSGKDMAKSWGAISDALLTLANLTNPSIPSTPPDFETTNHTAYTLRRTSGTSVNASLGAQFLSLADAKVGADRSTDITLSFEIDSLETRRLLKEPQDDDLNLLARLQEQKVQATIRSGLFGARSVYLITGLKIARGLSVQREEARSGGGTLGGSVPIVEGISAGGEIGGEKRFGTSSEFKVAPEEEIIFAYQVYKIKPKSRKASGAAVDIYETDAAFLHGEDEGKDNGAGSRVEIVPGSKESLMSEDDDNSDAESEVDPLEFDGSDNDHYVYVSQN